MGKKSKQKKNKFKDFQKVKLKVGKRLPKGQNETIATFKTRSIQITEQLKRQVDEDQATTKRKLNINDLLRQCQHYNTTVKQDAVVGIRELLNHSAFNLQKYLGVIIEKCCDLLMDKEATVRSSVHQLFRVLFPVVSTNQMSAFFPMLSAHLCCAMTHIDDYIQQDSLVILDLCLLHFPGLVIQSSSKIMSNFIEQISRLTQTSKKGSTQRTLLVNPSSKLSSQKWRNRVLERLEKFFTAWIQCNHREEGAPRVKQYCTTLSASHIAVPSPTQPHSASHFSIKKLLETRGVDDFQSFVEVLVPLLLQCWLEAAPSQLATNLEGNALDSGAMTTLWNVLSVLQLLMDITHRHSATHFNIQWFTDKYLGDLVTYFLPYFPYQMHEERQTSKTTKGTKSQGSKISVKTLNLAVCKVMSYFMGDSVGMVTRDVGWQNKVLAYLTKGVTRSKLTGDQVALVVGVTERVTKSLQNTEVVSDLLELAYDVFTYRLHKLTSDMRLLLHFLADFSFTENNYLQDRYPILDQWVCTLPSVLLTALSSNQSDGSVVSDVLHCLKSAASFKKSTFISELRRLLFSQVMVSEVDLLLTLSGSDQKRLLECVYWVGELSREDYSSVVSLCLTPGVSQSVVYHLLTVISCHNTRQQSDHSYNSLCAYLSFLITLVLGGGCVESLQTALVDVEAFKRRMFLIQTGCDLLHHLPESQKVTDVLAVFLHTHLKSPATADECGMPLMGMLGLLHLVCSDTHRLADRLTDGTLLDCLTTLFNTVVDKQTEGSGAALHTEVKNVIWETCVRTVTCEPRLCDLYIKSLCSALTGSEDLDALHCETVILKDLLSHNTVKKQVPTVVIAMLNQTVVTVETQQQMNSAWWSEFKYELSLLK